jgi:uncharacterized membrane protein
MQGNRSRALLSVFFIAAGVLHFIFPAAYMKVMPPWLPAHLSLVLVSGGFEILGGVGVLLKPVRRWAGYGLILLALAVLPANVQMLLNALADGTATVWLVLLGLRLPLQLLLIYWIWRATQPAPSFFRGRQFRE